MTNLDWTTLIAERDEWVARNFPPLPGDIPGNDSILGCIEEVGELAHSYLKAKQGIRGTPEEHDAAGRDAIGDIVVYLLGVISANIRPDQVTTVRTGRRSQTAEDAIHLLAYEVGLLREDRSWSIGINNILKYCEEYCTHKGWDFDTIVQATWDHVKQRDWVKHRAEGGAKNDSDMEDPENSAVWKADNPQADLPRDEPPTAHESLYP